MSQILALIWMQERLELLDAAIVKLRQLRVAATADSEKIEINGRLAELNMAFAHAKAQYEVAKLGASRIEPPSKTVVDKVRDLSDRIEKLVINDKAVKQGMEIAGEIFVLMKALAA